jgi:putative protease
LGGSKYDLESLTCELDGGPMVPLSVIGRLRRELVDALDTALQAPPERAIAPAGTAIRMLDEVRAQQPMVDAALEQPQLRVLCRTLAHVESILASGVRDFYVDFHDIRDYRTAVRLARAAEARIYLATLRIHKPGENGLFLAMAKQAADGWLVRNLAALRFARDHQIPCVGDFSLNVTNPLTAKWYMQQGLQRATASYDLNRDQLFELVDGLPSNWLEVVIHQHMPLFHMEHCVFCSVLSPGTNKSNCGRPCDRHSVKLKDRVGIEHVLHADVGCRNTLFNGTAQSGAEAVSALITKGVRDFRIELLRDASTEEVAQLITLYRDLLAGRIRGSQVWKTLRADNRVGVTRGTLEQSRNPLAIL